MGWKRFFRREAWDEERSRELETYLQLETDENIARGMSAEEARYAARRKLGNPTMIREEIYRMNTIGALETVWQDAKYAARVLRKSPAFTVFAVAVLALGIAANTAIFSIADTVLLRPLPYRDARRLVMVWEDASSYGFPENTPAPGNFSDWKARNHVFEDTAALLFHTLNLTGDGTPEQLNGTAVSSNLFSVLGVSPALGRDFRSEDNLPGSARVTILSHGLWARRFGANLGVIGQEIRLEDTKYTVIGVMPEGFLFPDRSTELWVPWQLTKEKLADHGSHFLNVIARLKPGVSLQTANAELATIARQIEQEHPDDNAKVGAFAVPLREHVAGDIRPAILMLFGAVCFVLLIACANIANLLLARASGKRRELAMRLTLGASRLRIIGQMLTESLLLAMIAGSIGLALSVGATQFLASLIPAGIAPLAGSLLDGRVFLFTAGVSILTGILFGVIPAMRVSSLNLATSLKDGGGRNGIGSGGQRLRDVLVVSEVALAIVLLAGAALMIRSFENLVHLDPGFRADHVLVLRTPMQMQKYDTQARRAAFYDQVLEKVEHLPGVVAVGYTTWIPLTNEGGASGITIEGHPEPAPGQMPIPNARVVSHNYMSALRMKLIEGRLFDERDGSGTQLVALINQTMARSLWPGENPVGKRFKKGAFRENVPWITIVGIVGDVHQAGPASPARAEMYLPYQQQEFFAPDYLAVRTSGEPLLLAESVRQQIWSVDKQQPVAEVMPLERLVGENLAPRRMQASLLGGFAGLALLLASIGIYAVLSFVVTQRTQEIGVRVALGAHSRDVLRMILSHGLKLFAIGAVLGLVAALALSRTMGHLLYGISASDPFSFLTVTFVLGVVTLLACYIPARRAMRVDPLVALRYE
ncbi:MAG TPA: ABC transporter permease [Candidatus Acidoferrum sp.]|nr:ABC transporter permease [Candidatus Acidoferrum sp.]